MKIGKNLNPLWWLNPAAAGLMALAPFVILGHLIQGPDYHDLWYTEKYLDRGTALLLGAIMTAFLVGSLLQKRLSRKRAPVELNLSHRRLEQLFIASWIATLLGYLVWAVVCFLHGVGPGEVLAVLRGDTGASYAIRDLGTTLPGVSTATQFGMACGIFGVLLWQYHPSRRTALLLASLVFLSIIRSIIWSERVAAIEVLVPMLVLAIGRRDWDSQPRLKRLLFFAPIVGCGLLYVYFTVGESLRSWGHYAGGGDSLWHFAMMRMGGYYITALNNGALMYQTNGMLPFPYTVFEAFWKFPGMNFMLPYNDIFGVDPYAYQDALKTMANPEFNNPSGIFPYVLDFGPIGACIFFFLVGWMVSAVYAAFRRGAVVGLLCYPLLYIFLLEISRVPYLTSSRTLPSWIMLFLGCRWLRQTNPGHRFGSPRRMRVPRGEAPEPPVGEEGLLAAKFSEDLG
jgi:oligosaccharide repeat unit polymerase